MGISLYAGLSYLHLGQGLGFHGHLVTLSRYNTWFTLQDLENAVKEVGLDLAYHPTSPQEIAVENGSLPGSTFFKMLGFEKVTALEWFDVTPDVVLLDLNCAETPEDLVGIADAVFDLGTSEHVFHQPNLLSHMGRMLKTGGIALHHSPGNNQYNHGFYQFSPALYADYYEANRFDLALRFVNASAQLSDNWQRLQQLSLIDCAKEISPGPDILMNLFAARKTERSTVDAVPQQSYYAKPD